MTLDEARKHLGATVEASGNLYDPSNYVCWNVGKTYVKLDGDFDADDLEAMAIIMRASLPLNVPSSQDDTQ